MWFKLTNWKEGLNGGWSGVWHNALCTRFFFAQETIFKLSLILSYGISFCCMLFCCCCCFCCHRFLEKFFLMPCKKSKKKEENSHRTHKWFVWGYVLIFLWCGAYDPFLHSRSLCRTFFFISFKFLNKFWKSTKNGGWMYFVLGSFQLLVFRT